MASVTREDIYRIVLDAPSGLIARIPPDPDTRVALRLLDLVNDLLRGVIERQERAQNAELQGRVQQMMRQG